MPSGDIAIIRPAMNCGLTIEDIAAKDTPEGVPYLIIDADLVPADRDMREAWTADFSEPHGYGDSRA